MTLPLTGQQPLQETIAKRETQNLFLLERPNKEGLGKAYLRFSMGFGTTV